MIKKVTTRTLHRWGLLSLFKRRPPIVIEIILKSEYWSEIVAALRAIADGIEKDNHPGLRAR